MLQPSLPLTLPRANAIHEFTEPAPLTPRRKRQAPTGCRQAASRLPQRWACCLRRRSRSRSRRTPRNPQAPTTEASESAKRIIARHARGTCCIESRSGDSGRLWPAIARRGGCCEMSWRGAFPRRRGGRRDEERVESCAAAAARQAAAGAVVCRQSLRRLWAALVRRHSERAADLPRRKKRSMRRLNLVSAKIGSIIAWRLA